MTQIRWSLMAGLAGWLFAAPSVALAYGGNATVSVTNRFDGEAEVWIDGRFQGMIRGDSTAQYPTRPGESSVVVKRPGTNYVLATAQLRLAPGTVAVLPVEPPKGTVRVTNGGEVPLKVDADNAHVWILPGTSAYVPVFTGNVDLHASIKEPGGEWEAIRRDLWVEPGKVTQTLLKPDPTVVVITNRDYTPVHALLDGVDGGWIGAGETERIWIHPGPTQVVLLDGKGRVKSTTSVVVSKGTEQRIVVAASAPPQPQRPPVVVVNTGYHENRPGGPIRDEDGDHHCSPDHDHDDHGYDHH
ncbi:MAG: hypothetical protein ABMB14_27925 [Myxococcota bacterium]